jgi:hypothetical protein
MFRSISGAAVIPATQYINKTTYTSFNTAVFQRLSSIGISFVVLRSTINRQRLITKFCKPGVDNEAASKSLLIINHTRQPTAIAYLKQNSKWER